MISRFSYYGDVFDESSLFTGPSIYFHRKTLETLRGLDSIAEALSSDLFFDYMYATLASWGLHRMGRTRAKLADIEDMRESFRTQATILSELEGLEITRIRQIDLPSVVSDLWKVIASIKVSASETRIVAGSKALHHILPNLVPPIDGEYTLRFFYGNRQVGLSRGENVAFSEIYPMFHKIALSCKDEINSRIGCGMNTSQTKVIDNAIVGFALKELRISPLTQEEPPCSLQCKEETE